MYYPKVLIAAPTADVKDYCFEAWLQNVINLAYPKKRLGLFLADNSEKNHYSRKIRAMGLDVEWVRPKIGRSSIVQRMAVSHNRCLDYAISNKFDYLLHLETDVFPPATAVIDLICMRRSVAALPYFIGQGRSSEIMIQVQEVNDNEYVKNVVNLGLDAISWMDGSVKPAFHAGLGCVLIHRSLFNKFRFRYVPGVDAHPDTFFAQDLMNRGQEVWVDTSRICHHENRPFWKYRK